MKAIFFILAIGFGLMVAAQENPTKDSTKYSDPQNMDVVYTDEAHYVGGEAEMYSTIFKSLTYSDEAKKANIDDDVMLSFDVNFDGELKDFTLVHGIGFGIDDQIITIIKGLKFEPAVMNGIQVRQNVMLTIPIRTYPEM